MEIFFENANSRETYFTLHNVREAHRYSKGKGIKVGIIDWLFATKEYESLYAGSMDFTNSPSLLYEKSGHGLWMATVLREVAPECQIFALNACKYENNKTIDEQDKNRSEYFVSAINWAINNKIDILTYSHPKFSTKYLNKINQAINDAVQNGIITTFIHNDNPNNIWPYACFSFNNEGKFNREPDVNIFHFDYNILRIKQYENYVLRIKNGESIANGNDLPYFSFSSMSPVLGGFIAMLKNINPRLNAKQCKDILIKTSYEINDKGENWYDINPCQHVIDIEKALKFIFSK